MKAIRAKNLRSLRDTGYIDLRPLTLLLGRNSSGKSTLLRTFPLLRQSVEARTTSPILWYGDYVDFGDFNHALRKSAEDQVISFGFRLSIDPQAFPRYYFGPRTRRRSHIGLLGTTEVDVRFDLSALGPRESTNLKSVELSFSGQDVALQLGAEGKLEEFTVNSFDVLGLGTGFRTLHRGAILPMLVEVVKGDEEQYTLSGFTAESDIGTALVEAVEPLFHGNVKESTKRRVVGRLGAGTDDEILEHLPQLPGGKVWRAKTADLSVEDRRFQKIRDLIVAGSSSHLLTVVDTVLDEFASSVGYMKPLRAVAQRYYRMQGLAVDEVDMEGENLAMFLRSLRPTQREEFQSWLVRHFGISVDIDASGGHLSLIVTEERTNREFNLADVGFGMSQILPIVAQVWTHLTQPRGRFRRRRKTPVVVALEQPELHLHPSLQARVADMLVDAIGLTEQLRIPVSFVVETHSEAMINRIGQHVYEREFDREKIQVLLFEKNEEGSTSVRHSQYDVDGYLEDWPYGFFEAGSTVK